jgi:hypothetical protein
LDVDQAFPALFISVRGWMRHRADRQVYGCRWGEPVGGVTVCYTFITREISRVRFKVAEPHFARSQEPGMLRNV